MKIESEKICPKCGAAAKFKGLDVIEFNCYSQQGIDGSNFIQTTICFDREQKRNPLKTSESEAREKARQRAWEIVQRDFRQPMEPEGYMRATAGLISGLEEAVVAAFEAYESALRQRDEKVEDSIKVVEALMKIEEQFSEPWWCVGKPSDLAEHIVSRFADLRAKLDEAEKKVATLETTIQGITENINCGTCAEEIFTGASLAGREHTCGKPTPLVTITELPAASTPSKHGGTGE